MILSLHTRLATLESVCKFSRGRVELSGGGSGKIYEEEKTNCGILQICTGKDELYAWDFSKSVL